MRQLAGGVPVIRAAPVRGVWRTLDGPDDVLALLDEGAAGVVVGVEQAGATFLTPILHEVAAVVCSSGTPRSHIGIVARDFRLPCVMGATFVGAPPVDGDTVEVDCSGDVGIVRAVTG